MVAHLCGSAYSVRIVARRMRDLRESMRRERWCSRRVPLAAAWVEPSASFEFIKVLGRSVFRSAHPGAQGSVALSST